MATREEIGRRAYEIWLSNGKTHGHHQEDWAQAERELGVSVWLEDVGANKIGVIRELRTVAGLSLEEARDVAERAPRAVKRLSSTAEAEAIRARLAAVGATVQLR